jgi:16S rRNA (guanine966-N2)-methyltransferase
MSRGAAFCVFVETDAGARGTIRDNCETLGLFGTTRIQRRSAIDLGPIPAGVGDPFSIAFLDPPYNKDLVEPALAELATGGWLAEGAIAVVETAADEVLAFSGWDVLDTRAYGAAKVSFLKRA